MTANGYAAITTDGNILVDTVSSQGRGAMVNWLVVHAGFMVPGGMGDFAIREAFALYSEAKGVTVQPVTIMMLKG